MPSQPPKDDLAARLAALLSIPHTPGTPSTSTSTSTTSKPPTSTPALAPRLDAPPPPPPGREDALADRLRLLRGEIDPDPDPNTESKCQKEKDGGDKKGKRREEDEEEEEEEEEEEDDDDDGYLKTDDQTLEELLADVGCDDDDDDDTATYDDDYGIPQPPTRAPLPHHDHDHGDGNALDNLAHDLHALSIPSAPTALPTTTNSVPLIPSVPRTKPGTAAPKFQRLAPTSRAGYTDADARTWCVVCVEDATLRCIDCDDGDDVYCARCWYEMHRGPRAAADDWEHRAVGFERGEKDKEKRVLVGA